MPDLTTPPADVENGARQAPSDAVGATPDPLQSLFKMSTTAGLSRQDYVAINLPSIASVLLGIASVLSVLGNILLVIPLAGVVCAVVSLRQIANSNGTQTGRGFAWGGLALSLLVGGTVLGLQVAHHAATRADEKVIAAQIKTLGEQIRDGKYDAAYASFNERFHSRVTPAHFAEQWQIVQNPLLGRITALDWNGEILFLPAADPSEQVASAGLLLHFDKVKEPSRDAIVFRKQNGIWSPEDLPRLFPPPKAHQPTPIPDAGSAQ